ncbi:recombinase family protein [Clostridium cochlearium]|uniref:recombinase family protein n=1 Tax=Clostridium cochlearium TaxID=1494 RepID=UPI00241F6CAC|nr:recombinase family protein [Clostridium cochlearium]MBE6065908.1 recombinase family protein [Clostridium cochlearium]
MAVYGYHRTSTTEQHLDRGINTIKEYCKNNNLELIEIFTDKASGINFDRPDYKVLKRIAKKGDIIILSELDRLGRNKLETLKELQRYKDIGVRVMILEIPTTLFDYSKLGNDTAAMLFETVNNMLIEIYATLAQAETEKHQKRQKEGIQAMKDRGDWQLYGRPKLMSLKKFEKEYEKILSGELRPVELMRSLNISAPTYYRYRKKLNQK